MMDKGLRSSKWRAALWAMMLFGAAAGAAWAAYSIKAWSFHGGGAAAGGQYKLRTVIAQPGAGTIKGGQYVVHGGFLQPIPPTTDARQWEGYR